MWNKIFGSNKPISTTRIRIAVVTEVRRAVPNSRDVLARHLCHEPATADSSNSKMSRLITAVMEGESEVRFYIDFNVQSFKFVQLIMLKHLGIRNYQTDCTDKLPSRGIS